MKKRNEIRILNCIKKDSSFFRYQNYIKNNFLNKIPISGNSYGFVMEKSYKDFLSPHIQESSKGRLYLRLDIKKFFDSITQEKIKKVFIDYFKTEDKVAQEMLAIFSDIVTVDGHLPQCAITSPSISNIVFRQVYIRIQKYCEKFGIIYTRYADDLLFSSEKFHVHHKFFKKKIVKILNSQGYKLNENKTIMTKGEISLNGFVVGKSLRISRKKMKNINLFLYIFYNNSVPNEQALLNVLQTNNFKRNGLYFTSKSSILNFLNGYRSFLISWLPSNKSSYEYKDIKKRIKRIEKASRKIITLQ